MTDTNQVIQKATQLADAGYEIALAIKIEDQQMLEIAADELKALTKRGKEIEELRLSLTRPLDESKKGIMALFATPLDRITSATSILRKEITRYQGEQEAIQRAERARAEAEARERQRQAQDAARAAEEAARSAIESGDVSAAMDAASAAAEAREVAEIAAIAPVQMPVTQSASVSGITSRETWKFEVTDKAALVSAAAANPALLAFIAVDEKAIGAWVRSQKENTNIPGIRAYSERGIAVRS